MNEQPQTWHYGLVAQYWAEFQVEGPEIAYFQKLIEKVGQPALDVACGTGRLLLPYLRAGLDVDGCDISPDMLALCAEKARLEGFSPRLYPQAMHELDLPRTYQTIFVCGGFGIGGSRQQDISCAAALLPARESWRRAAAGNSHAVWRGRGVAVAVLVEGEPAAVRPGWVARAR